MNAHCQRVAAQVKLELLRLAQSVLGSLVEAFGGSHHLDRAAQELDAEIKLTKLHLKGL